MGFLTFLRLNARWLAAAFILTFSSSYGQTFFISIFANEFRTEFGLSNGAWGGVYTLGTSISAVVMIWGGALTDIFRVRLLGPLFLGLLALSCIAVTLVWSVWALVLVVFALRFTGQGMASHIAMVATARWFVATRGKAMSIASMGFALGNAVMPIIFVALLSLMNWRSLWILAAVLAVAAIPILTLLLRHERTPKSISESSQSTGMYGRHWKRPELLRHWLFWLMVPTLMGPSAWGTAMFFQQVHIAQVKGWTQLEFVSLFPIYIVSSSLMTLMIGWVIDRLGTNRILPFYLLPFIAGFLVLGTAQSLIIAAVGMVIIGAGSGIGNTMLGAFWAEHCGTRHLGSIKALAAAVMVFGSAIGPGVSGWLIDQGIDFPQQTFGIAVYFVIAAVAATVASVKSRPLLTLTT